MLEGVDGKVSFLHRGGAPSGWGAVGQARWCPPSSVCEKGARSFRGDLTGAAVRALSGGK